MSEKQKLSEKVSEINQQINDVQEDISQLFVATKDYQSWGREVKEKLLTVITNEEKAAKDQGIRDSVTDIIRDIYALEDLAEELNQLSEQASVAISKNKKKKSNKKAKAFYLITNKGDLMKTDHTPNTDPFGKYGDHVIGQIFGQGKDRAWYSKDILANKLKKIDADGYEKYGKDILNNIKSTHPNGIFGKTDFRTALNKTRDEFFDNPENVINNLLAQLRAMGADIVELVEAISAETSQKVGKAITGLIDKISKYNQQLAAVDVGGKGSKGQEGAKQMETIGNTISILFQHLKNLSAKYQQINESANSIMKKLNDLYEKLANVQQ